MPRKAKTRRHLRFRHEANGVYQTEKTGQTRLVPIFAAYARGRDYRKPGEVVGHGDTTSRRLRVLSHRAMLGGIDIRTETVDGVPLATVKRGQPRFWGLLFSQRLRLAGSPAV